LALLVTLLAAACAACLDRHASPTRWAVYYAAAATPAQLLPYDLLVLDADSHPPLEPLLARHKQVLGYLSVGEVARYRRYFAATQHEGMLLDENPSWPGSFAVDIRDPRWVSRVLDDIVPAILQQGFHGIFIDTLDQPLHLETTDPQKFKGMRAGTVDLVRTIRRRFPHILIMVNRGYAILPQIAPHVDMVLGESVYATYDFATQQYRRVAPQDYQLQLQWLKAAQAASPRIKVMTLDYWDPEDSAGIAAIYTQQRNNGFLPYVATIKLDRLVPEPEQAP
jgi:uncharacterized protein (TIGR01370 family)